MNGNDERDRDSMATFEEELRRWAARPPKTPASYAAARLARRLGGRPRQRPFRLLAATATAALALAAAVALWPPARQAPPARTTASAALPVPVLDEDVVVLWIDRETPLYLTLTPPDAAEKGGSS